MAHSIDLVGCITLGPAAEDLRGYQHRAVELRNDGNVYLHGGVTSHQPLIMQNRANSGDPVSVSPAPNVTKAVIAGPVTAGAYVGTVNSGAGLEQCSISSIRRIGVLLATITGSGNTGTVLQLPS